MPKMKQWNGTSWVTFDAGAIDDGTIRITPNAIGILSNSTTLDKSSVINISNEINARRKDFGVNVKDYNASGSSQATTGSITAGTSTLTLTSAIDFANGQGIAINHAGTACTLTTPATPTVTPTGTAGTTAYQYQIVALDNNGGCTAAGIAGATATGNASLSATNYNALSWTAVASAVSYAIYGRVSGTMNLLATVTGTTFNDVGAAAITPPSTLPTTPPISTLADTLITTITNGAGSTSLTLSVNATTSASSVNVNHDDTVAIQTICNYVITQGGRTIYFPDGTYNVTFDVTNTMYYALFKFAGNTKIQMSEGAKIKVNGANPKLYSSVFGVDTTRLPIQNIQFSNVNIEGIALMPVGDTNTNRNPIGISFALPYDSAANSVQNVIIENCKLTNLDYGIYIVHNVSIGGVTRQAKNVKIKGCDAVGCVGSFATVDGSTIIVEGNTADGVNPAYAYDAVSCHAGASIQIINNQFKNYGLGQVVNIRNSPENLCGTSNVVVANNIIRDCPTTGIQVSILSGESVYGVNNVLLSTNKIQNVSTGVIVTVGSASTGTPFDSIKVEGNSIYANVTGLQVNGYSLLPVQQIVIGNNKVVATSTNTGYAAFFNYVDYSIITGNDFQSTANVAGHKTVSWSNLSYDQVVNNKVWASNATIEVMTITTIDHCNLSSNYVEGIYSFTGVTASLLRDNMFLNSGTNEGRSFTSGWEETDANNVIVYGSAAPVTGTWIKGDIVINSSPAAAGYIGFICTVSGTSGTWKGYGAIQA